MKTRLILLLFLIERQLSIALPSGTVVEWGDNSGVAGGSIAARVVSVSGKVLTNAMEVAIGEAHYLALNGDGTVTGWGWNNFGQATGIVSGPDSGLVVVDGRLLNNVTMIAAGRTYSVGLKSNGNVVIWGADNAGHKIHVPTDLTNAISVAAGWDHCLVLTGNGKLVSLAAGSFRVLEASNVVSTAGQMNGYGAGMGMMGKDLAVKNDGSVIGWRGGISENLPAALTNVTALALGGGHNLALRRDGTVFGWGINEREQALGFSTKDNVASGMVSLNGQILENVVAIAARGDCSLALRKDGMIAAWGRLGSHPATVPEGLSNVVAIAAGNDFCLAITTNAAVAERFMKREKKNRGAK